MYIPRQLRLPNMQLRQRSCPWYFRANRMECHNRRHQVTPLREEIDTARRVRGEKGHKRARKRALLGPRWFDLTQPNSFGMNGGDDGTRTRDLCRDSFDPAYRTQVGPRFGNNCRVLGILSNAERSRRLTRTKRTTEFHRLTLQGSYFLPCGIDGSCSPLAYSSGIPDPRRYERV